MNFLWRKLLFSQSSPAPSEVIYGNLKAWVELAGVTPTHVQGVWWPKLDVDSPGALESCGRWIGLLFHGGGYLLGSARDERSGFSRVPRALIQRDICSHVLSLDYTLVSLSGESATSFPLQLVEALSAYYFLVQTLEVPPDRILLIGDSAGAHLALSLERYLLESKCLAGPAGIILFSPWCDMTEYDFPPYIPHNTSIKKFLGSLSPDLLCSPYFSPAFHPPPSHWPATFISSGANEGFASSIAALEAQLMEAGVSVTTHKATGILERYSHDFLIHAIVETVWPGEVQGCWQQLQAWTTALAQTFTGGTTFGEVLVRNIIDITVMGISSGRMAVIFREQCSAKS
ncbi:Steryl acetyl hydrolase 1 [Grifola frondosa]|uniref:Steryl acetyl hydrolase 1 n=1 Tax=Grifola frondosa TaxID=5627 RepID=A0A1C7MSK5_GRIFR|nr:Steryl acetyl hydrolase 1 [Grifola frondosa]